MAFVVDAILELALRLPLAMLAGTGYGAQAA